jgi:hypothetical protein
LKGRALDNEHRREKKLSIADHFHWFDASHPFVMADWEKEDQVYSKFILDKITINYAS